MMAERIVSDLTPQTFVAKDKIYNQEPSRVAETVAGVALTGLGVFLFLEGARELASGIYRLDGPEIIIGGIFMIVGYKLTKEGLKLLRHEDKPTKIHPKAA